jgi:hypothetical protein
MGNTKIVIITNPNRKVRVFKTEDTKRSRSELSSKVIKIHKAVMDRAAFISRMKKKGISEAFMYLAITENYVKLGVTGNLFINKRNKHFDRPVRSVKDRLRKLTDPVVSYKVYKGDVLEVADLEYKIKTSFKPLDNWYERFELKDLHKIESLIELELVEVIVK